MDKKTVCIIGGGAMGCLFGSFLLQHNRVVIYDTNPAVVTAINRHGIVIETTDGPKKKYPAQAMTSVSKVAEQADLAIIFTKAQATSAAALVAKEVLSPEGLALTLQNGIGHLEIISRVLGDDRTIAGVTAQAANVRAPGHAHHAGAGMTTLGSGSVPAEKVDAICRMFNQAGITTQLSDCTDSLIWGKLIINVGINALTATLRVTNGVLAETAATVSLMEKLVDEAVAVAEALDIRLPYDNPIEEVLKVCRVTASNRASMLQDVLRGAPTEIDVINGAIALKGKELGMPTPANELLTAIVKAIEATGEQRIL